MTQRKRGRPALNSADQVSDDAVLDCVLTTFGDHGFEGTSVREIGRQLGISHNLIPQRYGSKDKLWYAAIDYGFGRLARELEASSKALEPDDLEQLRGLIVRFVEINAEQPALLRIINQEAGSPGPRLDYLFETYIDPVRRMGEDWLDKLKAEGRITHSSVTLMYFFMTHGAGGFLALPALTERFGEFVASRDPDAVHEWAERAVSILFEGLIPRKPN